MVEPGADDDARKDERPALRQRALVVAGRAIEVRDQARRTVPAVDAGFSAYERDGRINGFVLAGALAFRLFVFTLPLYLIALVVAGATVAFDPKEPQNLAQSAGLSKYISGTIADAATTSKRSLWILVPVTLYALASASRSAYRVIAAAHASAWGLDAYKRPKPYLAILGFLGFALATFAGLTAFVRLRQGPLTPVIVIASAVYYAALWLAASRLLPRAAGTTIWSLVPGAVLLAAGSQGLYLFDTLYLNAKVESASRAYGALGIAASVLLWLYLLGRLMVASPVLNATLWERSRARRQPDPAPDGEPDPPPDGEPDPPPDGEIGPTTSAPPADG